MMKLNTLLFTLIYSCLSLVASVDNSIIPLMNQLMIKDLSTQLNREQVKEIEITSCSLDQRLRVMSFNMLLNYSESHLAFVDRWRNRKSRVMEYIQWAQPDVIGSQELQANQLDDVLCAIGSDYDYYGVGTTDGVRKGDIPAIFYRKDRLELLKGETFYFSETPNVISTSPFGRKNTFTLCHFKDKKSGREFITINTHLAFGNCERRYYEACKLRDFLIENACVLPLIITGDFNTFPFRQELDLPFYDGDKIIGILEAGGVTNSMKSPLFGHFGPIASTNFNSKTKKPFCSEGDPGIILDHVFVNQGIQVLSHGIDSARINGHFPSDHLPVIVDILLKIVP